MTSAEKAKEQYFEWQPHDDPEFAPLICGKGTIGGKGRSLLFALRRLRDSGDTDMSRVKVPRSIYLSIEIFHKFLERVPSLDTLLACGDPEGMERVFLLTPLPDEASLHIRAFLSDMHDPVVIRSSSRLEDDVKHSFAGKYLSTFLGNNKGTLEERARAVEDEVRRIYSRTFFPAAEDYRKRHKLGDDDMGIIIIRMAGRWRGRYYYPTMGGVGYSQNFRRWTTRIRQEDGLVRIVFGLGTMSTKRGYARTVSLTNPILRPEGFAPEKIIRHSAGAFPRHRRQPPEPPDDARHKQRMETAAGISSRLRRLRAGFQPRGGRGGLLRDNEEHDAARAQKQNLLHIRRLPAQIPDLLPPRKKSAQIP